MGIERVIRVYANATVKHTRDRVLKQFPNIEPDELGLFASEGRLSARTFPVFLLLFCVSNNFRWLWDTRAEGRCIYGKHGQDISAL